MACEEHKTSLQAFCQKCNAYVCDLCHKRDRLDHYHYLVLEKPSSMDESTGEAVSSMSEEKLSVIDKAEQIIQRQQQDSAQLEPKISQEEMERQKQEEQERLRQKALAAINRSKELG